MEMWHTASCQLKTWTNHCKSIHNPKECSPDDEHAWSLLGRKTFPGAKDVKVQEEIRGVSLKQKAVRHMLGNTGVADIGARGFSRVFKLAFSQIHVKYLSKERPTWCHLFYYYFIQCSKHVSDVNTSILKSLRLIRSITSWVVSGLMCVGVTLQCGYGGVVSVCSSASACIQIPHHHSQTTT